MSEPKDTDIMTITRKELSQLQEDSRFLEALRAAGVANWDGWDEAIQILEEQNNA